MGLLNWLSERLRSDKPRILFVCTENICRSPLAEFLLREHLNRIGAGRDFVVRSAGTVASMPGAQPDQRAVNLARDNGVVIKGKRARKVGSADFEEHTWIVALDTRNLSALEESCPRVNSHKLSCLLDYDNTADSRDVVDPYYDSLAVFQAVYQQIDDATKKFAEYLLEQKSAR
jgi:protein-tyrosine phosphatase